MEQTLSRFFAKVYSWTFLGLTVSALAAMGVNSSPSAQLWLYTHPWIIFVLIIVEFVLVGYLVGRLDTMSAGAANGFYFLYALLNGITLASIFVYYDTGTVSQAFFIAALMFIVMSVIGFITKADLSKMGTILFMGLIGIIIAMLINMFLRSDTFDYVLSIITVVVFMLLTLYDTKKLKGYYNVVHDNTEQLSKMATVGALSLYLDFINIFLALLRIIGRNR